MSRARRVGKLEPVIHERWQDHWTAYMDRVLDRTPEAAFDLIATDWPHLPPDQDAEVSAYEAGLFTELGLESSAWSAWFEATEAAFPNNHKNPKTLLALTPERVPKPPCNPTEALARVHGWTYPNTLQGRSRAAIALLLAQAVELSHVG